MRRAVGIVRVSRKGKREGASFISPEDQRGRIEDTCGRENLDLVSTAEEIDVSGGVSLERRKGLLSAIEAIEHGEAEVLIVGYFDRLVRSIKVQGEIVSRVEAASGEVLAVDYGRVSEETAAQWLSGTVLGAFFEFYRRSGAEKVREAQEMTVARGVVPYGTIPLGLKRTADKTVAPTDDAPDVVAAFEARRGEASIKEVRALLAERGHSLTYRQVQGLLRNRLLVGEVRFGDLVNENAHEPIVDRALFDEVQAISIARGPKARSPRLLARLGVLRCGTCGGRMSVATQTQNGRNYPFYRCSPTSDCPRRMAVSAVFAEEVVIDAVKGYLVDMEGRASVESEARDAAEAAERAQSDLDAAIRAFAGLQGEAAATERIADLVRVRDAAVERAEQLGGLSAARTITVEDWDKLLPDGKRALIQSVVSQAIVSPGRGRGRIIAEFFGK